MHLCAACSGAPRQLIPRGIVTAPSAAKRWSRRPSGDGRFSVRACSRTGSQLAISPACRPPEPRTAGREVTQHGPPPRRKQGSPPRQIGRSLPMKTHDLRCLPTVSARLLRPHGGVVLPVEKGSRASGCEMMEAKARLHSCRASARAVRMSGGQARSAAPRRAVAFRRPDACWARPLSANSAATTARRSGAVPLSDLAQTGSEAGPAIGEYGVFLHGAPRALPSCWCRYLLHPRGSLCPVAEAVVAWIGVGIVPPLLQHGLRDRRGSRGRPSPGTSSRMSARDMAA